MVARQYSNTAVAATVENAGGLSNGTTTLVLSATTGMPAAPFTMRIRPETANEELITVTGGLGTVGTPYTILRGVDGTSAVSHPQGSPIVHSVSARDFAEPQAHIENVTPGAVHGLPTNAWQEQFIVTKNVQQGYSSDTSLNNDNELKFTGLANTKYRVELNLYATGAVSGDIIIDWLVPAGVTGVRMCIGPSLGSANSNDTNVRSCAFSYSTVIGYGMAGNAYIQERSIVSFGSNGGVLNIRHAQYQSNATQTIVMAGSYMIVTKLT